MFDTLKAAKEGRLSNMEETHRNLALYARIRSRVRQLDNGLAFNTHYEELSDILFPNNLASSRAVGRQRMNEMEQEYQQWVLLENGRRTDEELPQLIDDETIANVMYARLVNGDDAGQGLDMDREALLERAWELELTFAESGIDPLENPEWLRLTILLDTCPRLALQNDAMDWPGFMVTLKPHLMLVPEDAKGTLTKEERRMRRAALILRNMGY